MNSHTKFAKISELRNVFAIFYKIPREEPLHYPNK